LMGMRDSLLNMYGVPTQNTPPHGAGKGAPQWQQQQQWGAPPAAIAAEADPATIDWKSKLIMYVSKRSKRSLTKGELEYLVEGQDGGYVAAISSQHLSDQYTGEVLASKRLAEHSAAKNAVAAEFPDEYAALTGAPAWGAGPVGGGGKKRTLEETGPSDSKSKLSQAMQIILGRPVQKGDIVYDTKAVDESNINGGYVSIVTIPTYDKDAAYEGEKGDGKKQAEQNAAGQLLAALQDHIAAAEEEHKAKKAKVRKERLAKMASKHGAAEGEEVNALQDE